MGSEHRDNANKQENSVLDSTMLACSGSYYIEFKEKCTQLMDGLHLQLQDLPDIVLVYNHFKDRLEVCTGSSHLSSYHYNFSDKVKAMSDLYQKYQRHTFNDFISTNPSRCYTELNRRCNEISKQHEQNEIIRGGRSTFSIQLDTYNSSMEEEDLSGACASVASAQNSESSHDIAINSNSKPTMKTEGMTKCGNITTGKLFQNSKTNLFY